MTPNTDSDPHTAAETLCELAQKVVSTCPELLFSVVEHASLAVLIFDRNGLIVNANSNFLASTDRSLADLLELHRQELGDYDEHAKMALAKIASGEKNWTAELTGQRADGREIQERRTLSPLRLENGAISHYIEVSEEISQGKISGDNSANNSETQPLQKPAHYDELTGLPNRLLVTAELERAIETARFTKKNVLTMLLGLSHFRQLNDALGHDAGDAVLKETARRILKTVSSEDTVARLGGDEFVVVMPNTEDPLIAGQQINQAITDELAEPFTLDNKENFLSANMGFASYPQDGRNAATLIHHASTAMHSAQQTSNTNCRFFEPEMTAQAKERLELERRLRGAMREDQLNLNFQPKLDFNSQSLVGAEALLRWKDSDGQDIAPDKFIPLAEDVGLIVPIGEWVLQESCRQLHGWLKQTPDIHLAINVSANQLRSCDFVSLVRNVLKDARIPASSLVVEITENVLLEDTDQINESLRELTAMGIRLSIDDFGTGYSSFSYLKRFQFHELKIDRCFIQDIAHNQEAASVAKGLITMAHSLGLSTVGEGAENIAQFKQLKNLNCDLLQGYYYHRPMNAENFGKLLAA